MAGNLLKKSSGLMLLCSVSLLMIVMTGCQEAKLKTVIGIANKQCPLDMGEVGNITSIIYDGDNVVYTLNMNEEITNIKILKDNPESMKSSIKMMFQNPAADVKEMLKLMAKCNSGLHMIFVGNKSGEQAVCELTAEELKEVINTNADPAQSGQTKLEAQLKMANLQFPMQASEEVVVEKIEIIGESVVYICSVDEELCPISQIEENAAEVKEGIVSTLASQTDPATQIFIKTCVENNKNITYLLIVPAVNLSGLTLSRMRKRISEIGVRKAFGAPRRELMMQVLSENMLYSLFGGILGLVLSYVAAFLLGGMLFSVDFVSNGVEDLRTMCVDLLFDPTVFLLAFLACFLLNLLSAAIPAWRVTRTNIVDAIIER